MPIARSSEGCARTLRILSDPTRLEIARTLLRGPADVARLRAALAIEASLLSHHLRVLREAGLVVAERTGRRVRYRLDEAVRAAGEGRLDLGCCSIDFARRPTRGGRRR